MMKHILIFLMFLVLIGCESNEKVDLKDRIDLSKAMGGTSDEDFSKAIESRKFVFPEDHGPHPDFRTEWWYFTGNLTSADNKKFGYQFTIFRTALSKNKNSRNSDWNSNQIYMAHFTVTDINENKFYFDERFSREGNRLAGAETNPFKVLLEDWQVQQIGTSINFDLPTLNISAKTESAEINLTSEAIKPFVLQGDKGLSQKGSPVGNASYYYSYTRLKTYGKIILDGKVYDVSGFSWMDREWSTSALSKDQKGWDWFSLQLYDNTEIMYYQMRKNNGSPDIFSKGVLVDENGLSQSIKKEEVVLNVIDNWKAPDGATYPSGWTLQIPAKNIDLKITPAMKDQLLDVSIKYWEGSVKIEGAKNGTRVNGRGYVELTGY
jgi:predicted secreted hydrolase